MKKIKRCLPRTKKITVLFITAAVTNFLMYLNIYFKCI